MDQQLVYPAGSIMFFTMGDYEDFQYLGFLVAIKLCDLPALAKEMIANKKESGDGNMSNFSAWLIANGHAIPLHYSEVYLGSYDWYKEFVGATTEPLKIDEDPEVSNWVGEFRRD